METLEELEDKLKWIEAISQRDTDDQSFWYDIHQQRETIKKQIAELKGEEYEPKRIKMQQRNKK